MEFSLQATISAVVTLSLCSGGESADSCCSTEGKAFAVVATMTRFEMTGSELGNCVGFTVDPMRMVKSVLNVHPKLNKCNGDTT